MNLLGHIKDSIIEFKEAFFFFLAFQLIRDVSISIYIEDYTIYQLSKMIFLGSISNFFFLIPPFLFFRFSVKKYLYIISPFLVLSNMFYLVHLFHLKAPITLGAIAVIAETTPKEASEFINTIGWDILISSILLSILPLLLLFFFFKKQHNVTFRHKLSIFLLLPFYVFLMFLLKPSHKGRVWQLNPINNSFIYKDFKQIAYYYREQNKLKSYVKNRPSYLFKSTYKGKEDTFNIVLVIGESMSKYHMQLYNYARETTPKLNSLENLYIYKDVISSATQTRESIIRMLSLANGKYLELFYTKGSIITAAKEAGFNTYWLSNQMILGISDTETSVVAMDAHYTKFINSDWNTSSLDKKLIPYFQNVLNNDTMKRKFIVIHMLGNHFKYENRYPAGADYFSNEKFHFPSYLNKDEKEIVNHYDKSIRYSDEFIYEVIEELKKINEPSVLLYLSDHGEEVYDDERLLIGHGSPDIRKEAIDIPFFIWHSEHYTDTLQIDKFRKSINNKYCSGDLFHTLADIMYLSFDDFDTSKSVISSSFRNTPRKVLNSNNQMVPYSLINPESE